MSKIIVSGIGTDVGKTVVSAILTSLFKGDYWKPIGSNSDSITLRKLLDSKQHHIFDQAYSLEFPGSPHHAARLEGISVDLNRIVPPKTTRPLIIESVGGIYVPLTLNKTSFDLFKNWEGKWIVVSQHYLGSINHTLLTIEALKRHKISIAGIIFNGEPNPDTENAILEITKIPFLARLLTEKSIDKETIQKYVQLWQPKLASIIP